MVGKAVIESSFTELQADICGGLEELDGSGKFSVEPWNLPTGGGGLTRVIHGNHIEKGGVNFSAVSGPASAALQKMLKVEGDSFFATGVSIVLHPTSPMVPIIHMNVRYFEMGDIWWFGGGIDVTPHYIIPAQAASFHSRMKEVCDKADSGFYSEFMEWADRYFYIKHRGEARGVGGIFFDRLNETRGHDKESLFEFVMDVGRAFLPSYRDVFLPNYQKDWGQQEKSWQMLRRSRYAEFNLVWDRGTKFGLETGGRTESILMSLPPQCEWKYNYSPEPGTSEHATLTLLKQKVRWLDYL